MNVNDIITTVGTLLTSVIVAYLGYRSSVDRKETKKIRQLREKLEAEREKNEEERRKTLDNTLTTLQHGIDDVNKKVDGVNTKVDGLDTRFNAEVRANCKQQADISKLTKYIKHTNECNKAVANLVTALAEGLRDQHLDGNITAAVAKYRKFETDALHDPYNDL